MSSITRRVVAGLGANAFGQAVNVGIQVVSLPLFLHRWDLPTYGTWLVLSAIPTYLSMADVGMVTAAGNQMTMSMGRGDIAQTNAAFQSVLALMTAVCGALAAFCLALFLLAPWSWVTRLDERIALLALAVGVLTALFGGLADAVFKASHRFATGALLGNLTRLGEWAGGIAGLFLSGTFAAVALGALAARLAGTLLAIQLARRGEGSSIRWGFERARRADVVALARPAISFMIFPLSNALSLQGVTLLVGHLFGPVSVAVFNAYRTLSRVAAQLTAIFAHALWAEFSRLYGYGGAAAVARLYRRSAACGALLAILVSVVLYFAAPMILRLWTHRAVGFEPLLMGLMLAYAAAGGLVHVPRIFLIATNLHAALARWSLVTAIAVLILSDLFGRAFGADGVGLAMLSTEAFLAAISVALAQRVVHEGLPGSAGALP